MGVTPEEPHPLSLPTVVVVTVTDAHVPDGSSVVAVERGW